MIPVYSGAPAPVSTPFDIRCRRPVPSCPHPPPPGPFRQDYENLESAAYAVRLFSGNLVLFGRQVTVNFSPKGRTE